MKPEDLTAAVASLHAVGGVYEYVAAVVEHDNRAHTERNTMITFSDKVNATLSGIARMLIEKNAAYGDSAMNPVRIFSKASTEEQLLVRIDDKLSRLSRGQAAGEDVVDDLIGYLLLLKIQREDEAAREVAKINADLGGKPR